MLKSAMIAPCCRKVTTPKAHEDHIHLQVLWIRAERKDFSKVKLKQITVSVYFLALQSVSCSFAMS